MVSVPPISGMWVPEIVLLTLAMTISRMRLLIADSQSSAFLSGHFAGRGYETKVAQELEQAVRLTREFSPAVVLLDAVFANGLERLRQASATAKLIVLADAPDPATVFRISKAGADDLIARPFQLKELEARVAELGQSAAVPVPAAVNGSDLSLMYGASAAMEEVRNTIEQVADTTATVLIRGESGTGKEVTARMLYSQSSRRDRTFVKVNCAAIPNELLESELFGYESGAFTGAVRQKLGKFEQANYGTIFLDEISEMHPALQAKLLHVLQDGTFSRLGGKREISVDVRVVAATDKHIEQAVRDGQFREDLFYRLNVITIFIPPLRERREEIPVLLTYFHSKYSEVYGKTPPPFSDAAVEKMMSYAWPGNIRELENLVKRFVIVGNEAQIVRELSNPRALRLEAVSASAPVAVPVANKAQHSEDGPSLLEIGRRAANQAEYEAIERVLLQTRWNRRQAAKILKVSYKALLNKLKAMEEEKLASESRHNPS